MKETPILFSGPMVRALLEGRKTQTRRVVKPQPFHYQAGGCWMLEVRGNARCLGQSDWLEGCPYGQPGDRLWVREAWQALHSDDRVKPRDILPTTDRSAWPCYPASGDYVMGGRIRPSIHMPRWASRLSLELTAMRVERLLAITEADALAEGITPCPGGAFGVEDPFTPHNSAVKAYFALWDSLNDARGFGWASNPWVWVLEFKLLEQEAARG